MCAPSPPRHRSSTDPASALGQHALLDGALAARTVGYAELDDPSHVLEIGPGTGILTRALLEAGHRVTAIELDESLRPRLEALAARSAAQRLTLMWGDALSEPWPRVDAVVANLPYGPALPLVFRALELGVPVAVLMLQARLAERLAADPGEPRYGGVTVRARRLSSARVLEPVAPAQFDPPPAVESALLRLRRVEDRFPLPPVPEGEAEHDGAERDDAGGAGDETSTAARESADSVERDAFWRSLLDTLFLHRDAPLRAALAAADAPGSAILGALDRGARQRLPDRPVAAISPNDFGRLAWAASAAGWRPKAVSERAKRTAQR